MGEKLGPGEVENLRMMLNQKLQLLLANMPLTEVVQNYNAQDFCNFEDETRQKVQKFRVEDFINHLIKTGQTDTILSVNTDHLTPPKQKPARSEDFSTKPNKGDAKKREVDLSSWMNKEEIEIYLKKFNPKISRRTIKSWIQQLEPLGTDDCRVLNKKIKKPSVCYSQRIVIALEKKITEQKQRKDWITEAEIARLLSKENGLNASPDTVSGALESISLTHGIDFEDRLDSMDREQPHYSPQVIEMIRQFHKERGEPALLGWKPLYAMLEYIKSKYPDQLNQKRDYRKMVKNFIRKQSSSGVIKADEDYKVALTDKNQPMMHFSPKVINLVEEFLISKK